MPWQLREADGGGSAVSSLTISGAAMPTTGTTKATSISRTGICEALQIFGTSATPFIASPDPATVQTYSGTGASGIRETAIQGVYGSAFTWRGRFALRELAKSRTVLGLYSSVLGSVLGLVDSPALAYIALQYSAPRGDTNWQFVYRATSITTPVVVDTGVPVVASGVVDAQIDALGAGAFTITLRDTAGATLYTSTISAGPSDGQQWAECWINYVTVAPLVVEWYGGELTFS